jgi:hypothetical protein
VIAMTALFVGFGLGSLTWMALLAGGLLAYRTLRD